QSRAEAAQERAETAFGRAEAAHGRADAAFGRADEVNSRLSRLWTGRNKRNVVETLHVQFGFDRADLSDGAQTALLDIIKELKSNADLTVDLEGYTDPTGPRGYNVGLSQRRVESVRRYLIENGADLARIYSVGMGPLTAASSEHAKLRRVTVRLMVNPSDGSERKVREECGPGDGRGRATTGRLRAGTEATRAAAPSWPPPSPTPEMTA